MHLNKVWVSAGGRMKRRMIFLSLVVMLSGVLFYVHRTHKTRASFLMQQGFIPFEESMAKRDPERIPKILHKRFKKDGRWRKIQALYNRHILNASPSISYRIPKIIHQIWLGGPLPEKYRALQKSWALSHPDWEYRLWTDESAAALKMHSRDLFESAVNWGEKADILRYEVLSQFGGLYVDMDFECLRPFDVLHQLCDFYAGLESIERGLKSPRLSNALIGCTPGHPVIQECLNKMSGEGPRDNPDLIQFRTGPGLITRAFVAHLNNAQLKNVAFPSSYFYPLPATERDGTFSEAIKRAWIQNESFGIHYWDASWIPKSVSKN